MQSCYLKTNAYWPVSILCGFIWKLTYLEKLIMFMCFNCLRGTFIHGDSCISDILLSCTEWTNIVQNDWPIQLGTSGWYTRVSDRSIPPWSTHQQAEPWHWIFSYSPSIVHLGWYTPNSPCLLLSNCKTQGFRPVPYQRKKLTSLDIIQTIISWWGFFFYYIMKHTERFYKGITV